MPNWPYYVASSTVKFVNKVSDFQATKDGRKLRLRESTRYICVQPLQLEKGEQLIVPPTSLLFGFDQVLDTIIGEVADGPVVTGEKGLRMESLGVHNLAKTGCAVELQGNSINSAIRECNMFAHNCILIRGGNLVTVEDALLRGYQGVVCQGTVTSGFQALNNIFQSSEKDACFILFDERAQGPGCVIRQCVHQATVPQKALEIRAEAGRVGLFVLQNNLFLKPVIALTGRTPDDFDVQSAGNVGVRNSAFKGNMTFRNFDSGPNNVGHATFVKQKRNWVPVGNGSKNHPLFKTSKGSARVEVLGSTTQEQRLVVPRGALLEEVSREITASMSFTAAYDLIGGRNIALRIIQKRASTGQEDQIGPEFAASTGNFINETNSLTITATEPVAPGDEFRLEVANLTDDNPVIVQSASLSIGE